MIHLVDTYLGQTQQGHIHETICKMRFGCNQRLPKGGQVNLGARDGAACSECCQHLTGVGGSSFLEGGAGRADPSLGGLTEEAYSDPRDNGKAVVRQSGAPILQTVEAHPGGNLGDYGFTHASEGEDPAMGVNDPYGEGDVSAEKGTRAARENQPKTANPYAGKNPYLARRWLEGWARGRRLMGLPV